MNIESWKKVFGFTLIENYPSLNCPYCDAEELTPNPESLHFEGISEEQAKKTYRKYAEVKDTKDQAITSVLAEHKPKGILESLVVAGVIAFSDYSDDLDGAPYLMNGFMQCRSCDGAVSINGIALESNQGNQKKKIKIEFFSPIVPLFNLSINIPKSIRIELEDSFRHIHFDPNSAASKLRRAIEQFCEGWGAKGKNLHQQICSLKDLHPEEAEYLESLKLVGNEGTHASNVDETDLLYAYQVFQFVLELYDRKARYQYAKGGYESLISKFGQGKEQLRLKDKAPMEVN